MKKEKEESRSNFESVAPPMKTYAEYCSLCYQTSAFVN